MAIINVSANISSDSSLQDNLNIVGNSGTVGITGDVIIDRIQVSDSAEIIFDKSAFVGSNPPAYIFIKFIAGGSNQHVLIQDSGGSNVYLKMLQNEVALLPWNGTLDLYAVASGTAQEETLEIAIFQR
jgi:hypothetical protein